MLQKWEDIESVEMSYDHPNRSRQCHRPLNKDNLKFFAILHQKLRSLDNALKMLYHIVSGQTHAWSETNARVKDAIKAAKVETIDHVLIKYGFLIDCLTQIGGNTSTGPVSDKFL